MGETLIWQGGGEAYEGCGGRSERSRDLDYQLRVPLIITSPYVDRHRGSSKLWEGWQKKGPGAETGRRWVCRLMDQSDAEVGSINYPAEQIGFAEDMKPASLTALGHRGQPLNGTTGRGWGRSF